MRITGEIHYVWRTVKNEGEVLETLVTTKRGRKAVLGFLKKRLRPHPGLMEVVTDRLRSYPTTMKQLGFAALHSTPHRANNHAENSHQRFRRRERAMVRFTSAKSLQMFVSIHASIHNHFNLVRHICNLSILKTSTDKLTF